MLIVKVIGMTTFHSRFGCSFSLVPDGDLHWHLRSVQNVAPMLFVWFIGEMIRCAQSTNVDLSHCHLVLYGGRAACGSFQAHRLDAVGAILDNAKRESVEFKDKLHNLTTIRVCQSMRIFETVSLAVPHLHYQYGLK